MFFKKSVHKLMEENFNFLLKQGFQKKRYQKGGDLEIDFIKDKICISIMYYYGVNNQYKKLYVFDVIIDNNKECRRLTECYNLFDKTALQQLEKDIVNKKIRDQLNLFSLFLKDNIDKII